MQYSHKSCVGTLELLRAALETFDLAPVFCKLHLVPAFHQALLKPHWLLDCMCRLTPQAFTWITSPWYAPLLGYLMFSVGVNLSLDSFVEVFKQPQVILLI